MTRELAPVADLSPVVGSLQNYIDRVNRIPMLTREEELELSRLSYTEQDREAIKRLVLAHLRFVVKIARSYHGYGLAIADLIQEGNLGLVKAVRRFDPEVGVRFVSFAVHWIKSEIHEFIIKNWRIVKIATTKAQRKLFFNLRSTKKRLGWMNEAEVRDVAAQLGVTPKDVLQMEARLNASDASFDLLPSDEDEASKQLPAPVQYLEAPEADPAKIIEHDNSRQLAISQLEQALKALKPRERFIVEQRWLLDKKATLHELAEELDVSAERIRQIEKQALSKVKQFF